MIKLCVRNDANADPLFIASLKEKEKESVTVGWDSRFWMSDFTSLFSIVSASLCWFLKMYQKLINGVSGLGVNISVAGDHHIWVGSSVTTSKPLKSYIKVSLKAVKNNLSHVLYQHTIYIKLYNNSFGRFIREIICFFSLVWSGKLLRWKRWCHIHACTNQFSNVCVDSYVVACLCFPVTVNQTTLAQSFWLLNS